MAKLTISTVQQKVASKPSKPVAHSDDDLVMYSHERKQGRRIVLIHGGVGAGKTFLAASASEHFPSSLPASKNVQLEDMFWIAVDMGATDGFKHNKISVPSLDLITIMSTEALWRKAGFQSAPSIDKAIAWAIQKAVDWVQNHGTKWVVLDTISTFDTRMGVYADAACAGSSNQYAPYKLQLATHELVHDRLSKCGANVIYLCHSRSISNETANDKKKNDTVLVAGGATFVPELTGAAPKIYKRDASLELFARAYKAAGKKTIVREVVTTCNDWGAEVKNRFENVLDPIEAPNLRRMFQKIEEAQK